jgi:mRNA interferase HigB
LDQPLASLAGTQSAPRSGQLKLSIRAEQPLKAWHEEATNASWTQPADIEAQYRSANVLKNRCVVFNIKGNDYRLIVAVAYPLQIVYVQFVGTHKEYDAVNAETVEMA